MKTRQVEEQVRRIHYALVATLTVLFGIMLTVPDIDVERAVSDARAISRLAHNWDTVWIEIGHELAAPLRVEAAVDLPGLARCDFDDRSVGITLWGVPWVVVETTKIEGSESLSFDWQQILAENLPPNALVNQGVGTGGGEPHSFRNRALVYGRSFGETGRVGLLAPSRLSDFQKVWKELDEGTFTLLMPTALGDECVELAGDSPPSTGRRSNDLQAGTYYPAALFRASAYHRGASLSSEYVFGWQTESSAGIDLLALRATVRAQGVDSLQRRLAGRLGATWEPGPFQKTFPDLAKLTEDLADVKLDQLLPILEEESRLRQAEIEITGGSFSQRWLAPMALLVTLVLQWLLLRHLSALEHARRQADDLPAWVGLYRDRVSTMLTALTIVVLPLWVSSFSALRMSHASPLRPPWVAALVAWLGTLVVLALASRCLYRWLHARRGLATTPAEATT